MALKEYWRKRDFKQTPEPAGTVKKGKAHRFVVQKHHASHLHFDFRLEMDGVLKSWAVPKGPTLDPSDKRLAMMVEDHPISYFDFEGIIPEGNYGAGTVMVWDLGAWEPLGDASSMLAAGDLKFRLKGKKLNGEFVLAHMKARRPGSKGNEWLLIKKRDEFAQEGFGANDDENDWSVISKRSLREIAGDSGSAEWESNRPATATSKTKAKTDKNAWLTEALQKRAKKQSAGAAAQALKKGGGKKNRSHPSIVSDKPQPKTNKLSETSVVKKSLKKKPKAF